jgi:hypothetical protein
VWTPARGKIRLDEAALDQWSSEQVGRHVGYLPQDVELFEVNIENFFAGSGNDTVSASEPAYSGAVRSPLGPNPIGAKRLSCYDLLRLFIRIVGCRPHKSTANP